jgi:hypothetical protein
MILDLRFAICDVLAGREAFEGCSKQRGVAMCPNWQIANLKSQIVWQALPR